VLWRGHKQGGGGRLVGWNGMSAALWRRRSSVPKHCKFTFALVALCLPASLLALSTAHGAPTQTTASRSKRKVDSQWSTVNSTYPWLAVLSRCARCKDSLPAVRKDHAVVSPACGYLCHGLSGRLYLPCATAAIAHDGGELRSRDTRLIPPQDARLLYRIKANPSAHHRPA
jgi:hypothetical protein